VGPYLDEIIFKVLPDERTLLIQLKTGEVDVFDNANVTFLEELGRLPGTAVYATSTLMYEHLDLNVENPILRDRLVRQAIAFATDRRSIAETVYGGFAEAAPLDEHPSSKYYDEGVASRVSTNLLAARKLLHEAGWVDRNGDGVVEKDGRDLRLTISATAGNRNRERTEVVLKDQYREVGIDLEIRNYNPTVLYGSYDDGGILKRGKFDIAMYAWLSSPEPASKQGLYSSHAIPPNGQNHPRVRNPELDQLLERGANELDEQERVEVYRRISGILVYEAPVVPLFWYTAVDVATDRLRNYRPNPTPSADTWNANTWYLADKPANTAALPR
jgi:peptide/nickel transport system substrate-binding protein